VALLNQIWAALSPLMNLFTPQQKLLTETRVGAKVTRTYDIGQTPYQRLLGQPRHSTTSTPAAWPHSSRP
jgi:hypothetical protein